MAERGLEQQLIDACEEATRKVARTLLHTEVYGLRTDKSGKTAKVLKGVGDAEAPPSEITCLKEPKSACGGASACTSQPWLKPILLCVKRIARCSGSSRASKHGSAVGSFSNT